MDVICPELLTTTFPIVAPDGLRNCILGSKPSTDLEPQNLTLKPSF
jgi:hypothetical protein